MVTTSLGVLFGQIVSHPFVSLSIATLTWFFVKVITNTLDVRQYSVSIHDIEKKFQVQKIFSAIVVHSSWFNFLLNINVLWNLRYLEDYYGSWYMVRYSIILILTEALISCLLVQFILKVAASRSSQHASALQHVLYSASTHTCTGLMLGWLAFQSVVYSTESFPAIFLLLGIVNISPGLAALLLNVIYYFTMGTQHIIPNFSGLFAGYLLATGMLAIVQNTYWTVCFSLNLLIILAVSWKFQQQEANPNNVVNRIAFRNTTTSTNNEQDEFLEVLYDTEEFNRISIEMTALSSRPGNSRNVGEVDEEAQPLLSSQAAEDEDPVDLAERGRWRTFPESSEIELSGSGRISNRRMYIDEEV